MKTSVVVVALLALLAGPARAQTLRPDQQAYLGLYKELVETNTTLSSGDCTLAAARMAARLKAAGFPDADLHPFTAPDHPKEGGLVVIYPGKDANAKAVLLLAHIDVVEAKREDWTRDPFTLVEEGGYLYARGASDDKSQASIYTDALIRFRQEGFRPRRTVKLALTCGEESAGAFNGAEYLAKNQRALIDAAFALNEGGGGREDAQGKPSWLTLQVGEKLPQSYRLEVTNPGGHSARPVPNNAIVHLAKAVIKLAPDTFPVTLTDVTRAYFDRLGKALGGETGGAMVALAKNPADHAAEVIVARDANANGMMRTTCVPTMLDAGHAENALPQRARAVVNCRIMPGVSVEEMRQTLEKLVADPEVKITPMARRSDPSKAMQLDPAVVGPAEKLAAELFPGTPFVPSMSPGATDAAFLGPVGIPTYGVPGILGDADGNGVHGLNERIRAASLLRGRDYIYRLIKLYADAP
jgi:acetylornithine deacetylase/succinyl-diaminopimelate desuccinylase-like protein